MNKNVIALAVAAAMAAPLAAQAEVKISGALQAEVVNVDGDHALANGWYATDGMERGGGTGNGENSGNVGSLKFAASEDLGNGLKAIAVYTLNVNVGDSNGAPAGGGLGTRDAFVGLSGSFGTVLAGTLTTPYSSSTKKWDPLVATFAQARGNYGMSTLHNSYAGNAVAYANKFGMAKVVAALVLDETPNTSVDANGNTNGKTNAQHGKSIAVNMPVGPVELAIAYIDLTDFGGKNADADALKLGVKYTAGAITVAGQMETIGAGLGTSDDGDDNLYLTGSYAMGANTFSIGYGQNSVNTKGASSMDNTYTAIGVKHALSKKTSVHAAYRASDNDSNADTDSTAFGAGLRIGF